MTGVEQRVVQAEDAGIRLDRWFRRHFPGLSHVQLEKLLRTGQVRLDGGRAKAGDRVAPGQTVRVPPLPQAKTTVARPAPGQGLLDERESRYLQSLVVYEDSALVAIAKPGGLAVQGGTRQSRHLDGLLAAHARATGQVLKLVHRLDRGTSGIMVLAKGSTAAATLAAAFRDRQAQKLYWALTDGVPKPERGRIDAHLAKIAQSARGGREAMAIVDPDDDQGLRAITDYVVLDRAGPIALVALQPLTGRTHQLRAHLAALGTPILGDRKYGGEQADKGQGFPGDLMLHAVALTLPTTHGKLLRLVAKPTGGFAEALALLGLEGSVGEDPFV